MTFSFICIKCSHSSACSPNFSWTHHKVSKFSDAKILCCNLLKIQTKRPNHRVLSQNDANRIANSEDPDQTAEQSDLGLHCLA